MVSQVAMVMEIVMAIKARVMATAMAIEAKEATKVAVVAADAAGVHDRPEEIVLDQ